MGNSLSSIENVRSRYDAIASLYCSVKKSYRLRQAGGAEGAEGQERTYNFWIQGLEIPPKISPHPPGALRAPN